MAALQGIIWYPSDWLDYLMSVFSRVMTSRRHFDIIRDSVLLTDDRFIHRYRLFFGAFWRARRASAHRLPSRRHCLSVLICRCMQQADRFGEQWLRLMPGAVGSSGHGYGRSRVYANGIADSWVTDIAAMIGRQVASRLHIHSFICCDDGGFRVFEVLPAGCRGGRFCWRPGGAFSSELHGGRSSRISCPHLSHSLSSSYLLVAEGVEAQDHGVPEGEPEQSP